ncbi:glycosyltransferase family 4 protein [Aquirufa sp. ROCK-SH2]
MNLLFLTLVEISDLNQRGIYQDLIREFIRHGHNVTIITPVERRKKIPTRVIYSNGAKIVQVKSFNIQKTSILEKGIGTLALEYQYLLASKIFCKDIKFDLILYSTPPITFEKVIRYFKKRDHALSYLLLKDIFPQNAIDLNLLRKDGLMHRFFKRKEKRLYEVSDWIGCMSNANVKYLLANNPYLNSSNIEVNPNSIDPIFSKISGLDKLEIRKKYGLPEEKKIFIYGGNLGKPQGIEFLIETIESNISENVYFLIIGNGTEFDSIKQWFDSKRPINAKLIKELPKSDYDLILEACDVGLIFLNKNFLIPNFPSRLLSYLEKSKPVIAATDPNSDVGDEIELANCGYKVLAGDINQMINAINNLIIPNQIETFGQNAKKLVESKFLVYNSYLRIIEKLDKNNR